MLKFTDEHEWLKIEGDIATVGITEYAAAELGDLIFVELPEVGTTFSKGDAAATVESVKTASEIFAPVKGEIVEINPAIVEDASIVNSSPEDNGWFFKIKLADVAEAEGLLERSAYEALIS